MHNVELTDIQGNILRGYNQPHFRYVYYRVHDCANGRKFLSSLPRYHPPDGTSKSDH